MISETDLVWLCCADAMLSLREVRAVCDLGAQELLVRDKAICLKAQQLLADLSAAGRGPT